MTLARQTDAVTGRWRLSSSEQAVTQSVACSVFGDGAGTQRAGRCGVSRYASAVGASMRVPRHARILSLTHKLACPTTLSLHSMLSAPALLTSHLHLTSAALLGNPALPTPTGAWRSPLTPNEHLMSC